MDERKIGYRTVGIFGGFVCIVAGVNLASVVLYPSDFASGIRGPWYLVFLGLLSLGVLMIVVGIRIKSTILAATG
jgi:hypothetical protein